MKKLNKIMSLVLIITMLLGTVNVYAYAGTSSNITTNPILNEKQFAIEAYENLDDKSKEIFLNYIQELSQKGDSSLLEYHIQNVDKNYLNDIQSYDCSRKTFATTAANPSIATQLAALNLPAAVEYGLLAFASALGVPVGNVIDVIVGLGLAAIIAYYWNDIKDVWDDIVDIFVTEFGSFVSEAFDYLSAKAQGLPTEKEFHDFDRHYDDHSPEFADMPGGNGKKPDKNKYWEMAKKFLKQKGKNIKEGVSKSNSKYRIKFNTKTLEYLIYNPKTGQIMTYFLPGWRSWHDSYKWALKALHYYMERVK
ncbi:hypothetical protein WG909_07790 [Peptostreptococcaceae bacterium AGR-M142]